ncbi:MAG: beta-phosphoglucomutase [Phycisphaerae bacterium]|nr:beta-phosphoglucomutase [Phycisphaerae bacterium]
MIQAVILDLDGVVVSTDEQHYQAWQRLADEEGIPFDRETNHRLRGVSRMASLEIILERATRDYSDDEKAEMAARKNGYYRQMLAAMSPEAILPGVMDLLDAVRACGVALAVASSSRNTPYILERIGLDDYFDAVADGNDITHSKPDPEVFLLAAERLGVAPDNCLVVEDARAGIEAALAGGMKALGVGDAAGDDRADATAPDLSAVTVDDLLAM